MIVPDVEINLGNLTTDSKVNMETQVLADKVTQCVQNLGDKLALSQAITQNRKTTFDGSNPDVFAKWLSDMDDVHASVDYNDQQTLWAASQLLKGTARKFYQETKDKYVREATETNDPSRLPTWGKIKADFITRYDHFNPAIRAKQKLKTALQQTNESLADYAERVNRYANDAYSDRMSELEVTETIVLSFINGIRDRRLQENVARKMPKTLGEAYSLAMSELRVREHIATFKDNTSAPEPMDCSAIDKITDRMTESFDKKLERVTETLATICQVLTTNQRSTGPPPVQQNAPNPSANRPFLQQQGQGHPGQYQVQPQLNQHYQSDMTHYAPHRQQQPYFQRQQHQFQNGYANRPPPRNSQTHANVRPASNQSQGYRWTADHRPICHFCGIVGHVHRVCRKKAAATAQGTSAQMQNRGN